MITAILCTYLAICLPAEEPRGEACESAYLCVSTMTEWERLEHIEKWEMYGKQSGVMPACELWPGGNRAACGISDMQFVCNYYPNPCDDL